MRGIVLLTIMSLILSSCGPEEQPNFIVLLVDDLGWADVACNNPNTFYETPNIDQLAGQGIRFTDAYASCPVCSPTRASIMTGKHPVRVGITDWIPGSDPKNQQLLGPKDLHALPAEEYTLPEFLGSQGYHTIHIGKWHLGEEGSWPEDHGFHTNIGGWSVGAPRGKGYYSPYGNPRLSDGPEGEFLTERLTTEALNFLDTIGTQPFFMNYAFYTVHTPIQAANKYIDYFKQKAERLDSTAIGARQEHEGVSKIIQDNAAYASMVSAMDEAVGKIRLKLQETGLDQNTYIIYTSDNGGLSTLHRRGYPTSNEPLRAGKGWCYEGGIRVPFILTGPGIVPGESGQPLTSMDIYPTLLELGGFELQSNQHQDGKSIIGLLEKPELDRPLWWHYPHYHGSAWKPGAAIRKGSWKLIEFYEYEKVELYNLTQDLEEKNDLSMSNPKKTKELQDLLHELQKEQNAQFPIKNPSFQVILN